MRSGSAVSLIYRLAVAGLCLALAARTIWVARADWLATQGTVEGIDRAMRLDPQNGTWLATAAVYRSDQGDLSTAIDRDLKHAAELNPLDSRVPMTLGLRAEFRGDMASAEKYLLQAVAMDRQFKPSWTLANFYVRRNLPEKAWPWLRHCLELEPLGYDTDPVFELCWNAEQNPGRILAMIPRRNPRLIQYLSYLVRTNRVEAVSDLWPEAMKVVDSSDAETVGLLNPLPAFLARGGHPLEAVDLWNRMVDRGMLRAGRLDPAMGKSFADPDFDLGLTVAPFGWSVSENEGVISSLQDGALRVELNGNESESLDIASTMAVVLPDRRYRLSWEANGSGLDSSNDPGFTVTVRTTDGILFPDCPPMLVPGNNSCFFGTASGVRLMNVAFVYKRAAGTTRAHGVLSVSKLRLKLQDPAGSKS